MAVYLGIYSILSIIGLSAKQSRAIWGFLILGAFLVVFMGQRYEVGCDYFGYWHRFHRIDHEWVLHSLPFQTTEWGFAYLTYFMQVNTGSYPAYLTLISFILVVCYATFARSFEGSYTILALLFPVIIVQLGMSGVRQALAGAFLMLAVVSFVKGRRLMVAAWILIAFQFHSSVIVFLPIALLAGREVSAFRLLFVLMLVTPLSGFLLAERFDSYSDRYIDQVYGSQVARGGIIRYFLVMIPVVIFFFHRDKLKEEFPKVYPLLKLFALICVSLFPLLLLSTVALHRFNYYVMPVSILIFNYLTISGVVSRAWPFVLYGFYSLSWFVLSGHAQNCYIPYQSEISIF